MNLMVFTIDFFSFYFVLQKKGTECIVLETNFQNGDFDEFKRFDVTRIKKIPLMNGISW